MDVITYPRRDQSLSMLIKGDMKEIHGNKLNSLLMDEPRI